MVPLVLIKLDVGGLGQWPNQPGAFKDLGLVNIVDHPTRFKYD
jgi:hypothetical protein